MKKTLIKYSFFTILLFLLTGCNLLLGPDTENNPRNNFDLLWEEFDRKYAQFDVKGIDWDEVYRIYSPQINEGTTNDELFQILSDVLGLLNDNHITLYRKGQLYRSGVLSGMVMNDFSLELIKEKYLQNVQTILGGQFVYGLLTPSTGYIYIDDFENDEKNWPEKIDVIINEFQNLDSIIIDIRNNKGGQDIDAFTIAGRFADTKRATLKTKYRNGPSHDDFGEEKIWYVKPEGNIQFTKDIILLTHLFTISAAENFTLAMRVLPHVVHMGSITSGAFANTITCELLNGWTYVLPIGLFRTTDNICYEGIGITPDVIVVNTEADLLAGNDPVLEAAITSLED
jgi:carboxyl-terminal processing protease